MSNSKELLEASVIRDYLKGNTRKQIAMDNSTSTGNVSNITNEWKKRIGKPEAESIREFAKLVKDSKISIGQCAEGFRIANLMRKIGVHEEDEDGYGDMDENERFAKFANNIYLNCKEVGIRPSIAVRWIEDLFACYSIGDNNSNNNNKHSFHTTTNQNNEYEDGFDEINGAYSQQQQSQLECNKPSDQDRQNEIIKENGNRYPKPGLCNKDSPSGLSDSGYAFLNKEVKIPFVSQISIFISQKKKECAEIERYNNFLVKETKRLELRGSQANNNLKKINRNESYAMHFIGWFYRLKKELWDRYGISIEEIPKFAKVIKEIKNHNHDPFEIIREYSEVLSVKQEIATKKQMVESLEQKEKHLNGNIASLDARLSVQKQTMDTFEELKAMGFGLAELKQIWNTILEISSTRETTPNEAVSIFIKDIEKNYYDKLLFEDRVSEMKGEYEKMRSEIPNYRYSLQIESVLGPTLNHLLRNGVTKEDIINMNGLVTGFANNEFYFDSQSEKSMQDKDEPTIITDRTIHWKMFIERLQKLGNINSKIREQIKTLEKTEKQVSDLEHRKQKIETQNTATTLLLNYKDVQVNFLDKLLNHFFNDFKRKFSSASIRSSMLFISIIYNYSDKGNKREDQNHIDKKND
jgi:hypothetical protein